ncbi:major capsid protein [Martelella mediterranea]|uniref:Major capsid protein E n=1 Tax=Martelella mediterranea TaxID=293089 RepID=A0A4R3NQ23_9HYPH|nr:major capsid protein [Martelella mediterranea]TCT37433.1 major capsid protein E [Martelella mediterranea]
MAPMNQRGAAVIDPILTTHAVGYRNALMISSVLFPIVTVTNRSMRVIKFGKESFRLLNTRRAPGAARKRVQYGYADDPLALIQDALDGIVPREHQEEAETVPGIDLGAGAVDTVLDIMALGDEVTAANLARNADSYDANHKITLAGTDRWTDGVNSDPKADIDAGKESVRGSTGRYPNTLALGPTAGNALKNHPKIKEQFKYTSADSVTDEMLARYFDIERVVIGKAVYLPENADEDDLALDVWGNDAVLAYVPSAGDTYQVPSYGYTYRLRGYPMVEQPWFDKTISSWIYPTTTERAPLLTSAMAGFLFTNAGASV